MHRGSTNSEGHKHREGGMKGTNPLPRKKYSGKMLEPEAFPRGTEQFSSLDLGRNETAWLPSSFPTAGREWSSQVFEEK